MLLHCYSEEAGAAQVLAWVLEICVALDTHATQLQWSLHEVAINNNYHAGLLRGVEHHERTPGLMGTQEMAGGMSTLSLSRMLFSLSLLLSLGHASWVLCRSHLSSSYAFRVVPGPLYHFPTGLCAGSAYGAEDGDVSELRSVGSKRRLCHLGTLDL